ncbi:hypothetical protein NUM3379_35620 [Kineococcus sp. NUM-3379]
MVTLSVTGVLVATSLAACGDSEEEDPDYAAVCVDEETQERVDDDRCDDDDDRGGYVGGFGWFFFSRGSFAPAIGQRVSGGTMMPPGNAKVVRGGVPAKGATISRGGLGGGSGDSVGG